MKNARPWIAIFVLAVLVRVSFLPSFAHDLPVEDELSYTAIATNVAVQGRYSQDGQTLTARRPPAYPLFLAPFARAFSDPWPAARFGQTFVDAGTALIVGFIALFLR